ncbi:segregation and condensation protein B [Microbacterium sp. SLBN-111]
MTDDPTALTESAARPNDTASVARRLEAILLILDEPQSLVSLAAAVAAPVPAVRQAIEGLVADYDGEAGGPRRGFELREVGGGWRLYVREEYDDVVGEFVNTQAPSRLSQAALETLAVIAYKQPVTRGQVASIRAVNVDSVVRTLLARGLITEVFTDPDTGADPLRDHRPAAGQPGHQLARRAAPHLAVARRRRGRIRRRGAQMSEEGVRLQKVLANAGVASRRVSEEMIAAGRVRVNGQVVTELGSRIDPESDLVDVDGVAVQLDTSKRYVILNKPTGVVSSMSDDRGRPDLRRFTKDWDERLFNVGRLDADTSGLLVLTNDGDLAHVLAHPSFGVTKVYIAKVEGQVLPQTIQRLIKGVELEDGRIAADKARLLDSSRGESLVELTLHSGKNRIVRRMMAEVGHPVVELVRRQFGPLHLGTLPVGKARELTTVERGALLTLSRRDGDTPAAPAE